MLQMNKQMRAKLETRTSRPTFTTYQSTDHHNPRLNVTIRRQKHTPKHFPIPNNPHQKDTPIDPWTVTEIE